LLQSLVVLKTLGVRVISQPAERGASRFLDHVAGF
jgi:hypothetical protein